jgi:hypothetical protein
VFSLPSEAEHATQDPGRQPSTMFSADSSPLTASKFEMVRIGRKRTSEPDDARARWFAHIETGRKVRIEFATSRERLVNGD